MAAFTLSGVIDLKAAPDIEPGFPIKVSVMRHCRVIDSIIVTAAEKPQAVKFEIQFDPGTEKPVGVTVVASPQVPDERVRSVEHVAVRVKAGDFSRGRARVEIGIDDRLLRAWLGHCRTYRVRGRVVCRQLRWDQIEQQFVPCEAPVRGARVVAKDVDRIWWWCRKDEVGSDFTDLNGNFEIEFRWCCWWWGPWWGRGWHLDPAIVKRIRDLNEAASPVIPLPPPTPELDLRVFSEIATEIELARPGPVGTEAAVAAPQRVTDLGRQVAARLPDAPDLRALHIWPWWPHFDCSPDIVFEVTQDCGDGEKVIYTESCSDTRWNIPADLSGVVLVANENACCPPCCRQPPDDDCLVIQGVGCGGYPITAIEQDMASPLVGYAEPGSNDRPFGRTLRILGVFGDGSAVDFYKLQNRRWLPATSTWTAWTDIPTDQIAAFTRSHWLGFPPPFWQAQTVAPELVDGQMVLKTTRRFRAENPPIVDTVDPTADDWLALWKTADTSVTPAGDVVETPMIPDGLYELRVIGYEFAPATDTLINPRVMPLCPAEGSPVDPANVASMKLRIDNRNAVSSPGTVHTQTLEPEADFPNVCAVVKNEDMPGEECVSVCGVLRVAAGDTITVHFRASDADGHLERYSLNAHWAESEVFSLLSSGTLAGDPDELFGPGYAQTFAGGQGLYRSSLPPTDAEAGRPGWFGGRFKVTVTVGDPVPGTNHQVFQTCCAYLLRLGVWKRTTNGCSSSVHFHRNWAEFSFTLVRTDLPCGQGFGAPGLIVSES